MGFIAGQQTVDIAIAGTLSTAAEIYGKTVSGLLTPSTFDGTSIKFSVSMDNNNYFTLTDPDTGSDVTIVAAPSEAYSIDDALLRSYNYVKLIVTAQAGTITTVTLLTE